MAVQPSTSGGLRELALFAGAGGGILAGHSLGWRTVCAVETDSYCATVLAQRQNDGLLPVFPIWSDVRSFDGRLWRGRVDVVSGGFPCQDISSASANKDAKGIDGERSGLWREFARIIREVRPSYVFVENSPVLTSRGLDRVLGDLADSGFDAEWGVLSASAVGAPHRRARIWIVGSHPNRDGKSGLSIHAEVAGLSSYWEDNPEPVGMDDELADRLDRLRALGNGQVPQCAAEAWRQLMKRYEGQRKDGQK